MKTPKLYRKTPRRSLKDRRLPNLSQARRIMPSLMKHKKEKLLRERFSTKAFQNPKRPRRKNPTSTRLGNHHHPLTRQNTSRHGVIGIPALPPRGSLQNMGTLIRCTPAPVLSTTPSRITHLERTLPQCQVTRRQCMGIISPCTLSRHPKHMNRRCTSLRGRHRL